MTFSIAEMFLLVWAIVATLGYGYSRGELKHHRMVTCDLLVKIAKGTIKVTETDEFIEFKEVE
jgi:hypothetical protein